MIDKTLSLTILPDKLAVYRLDKNAGLPQWVNKKHLSFWSITKTTDELSVTFPEALVPPGIEAVKGWKAIKIEGPLDLAKTGILASIINPLAKEKISTFVISTFETDYILIKEDKLDKAVEILGKLYLIQDSSL